MTHYVMICSTLTALALGYAAYKTVYQHPKMHHWEQISGSRSLIRIAAESPLLIRWAAITIEHCSSAYPYVEFRTSSCEISKLLDKARDGTADLILLSETTAKSLNTSFSCMKIPCCGAPSTGESHKNSAEVPTVYVLWNQSIPSPQRDRILYAIENDFYGS